MSRFGHYSSVGMVQITNELDNTDAGNPPEVHNWNHNMAAFVEDILPEKIVTNSVASYTRDEIFDDNYDCSIFHRYASVRNKNYRLSRISEKYRAKGKPFLTGEVGISGTCDNDSTLDRGNVNGSVPHNPVHHNSMWGSSFTGAFGTALIFYWDIIHLYTTRSIQHFNPINTFFNGAQRIPLNDHLWETLSSKCQDQQDSCLPSSWEDGVDEYIPDGMDILRNGIREPNVEALGLKSEDGDLVIGWVHSLDSYWKNLPTNSGCGRTTDVNVPDISDCFLSIENLHCGDKYEVQWWSTHPYFNSDKIQGSDNLGGRITKSSIIDFEGDVTVDGNGLLTIKVPPLEPLEDTYDPSTGTFTEVDEDWAPDYAFKLIRTSIGTGSVDDRTWIHSWAESQFAPNSNNIAGAMAINSNDKVFFRGADGNLHHFHEGISCLTNKTHFCGNVEFGEGQVGNLEVKEKGLSYKKSASVKKF